MFLQESGAANGANNAGKSITEIKNMLLSHCQDYQKALQVLNKKEHGAAYRLIQWAKQSVTVKLGRMK